MAVAPVLSLSLLACSFFAVVLSQTCNPFLPHCRDKGQSSSEMAKPKCKPRYLIAGKATDCTKPGRQKIIDIDVTTVVIRPNPPQFPGCLTVEFVVNVRSNNLPQSFFTKVEFASFNIPQISKLPCFNALDNGCGGYGNNCYYCDVCNVLGELQANRNLKGEFASQFGDVRCPRQPGRYKVQRKICLD
ncbi:unnamed protein product, partial [Soboliphyme baturini]|uniref:Uncharacterized protein n=1 Tax=Soboliphyme baturini TaxID=241478 RepID=A0A183IUA8_9BILA